MGRGRYISLTEHTVGADKIDPGNYARGEGCAYSISSQCAAEFGEYDERDDFIQYMDETLYPLKDSPTGKGAIWSSGLSNLSSGYSFRARITRKGDWSDLINSPPDLIALAAPKLNKVPFPEVMVARCFAHESTGLDFVLRGPANKTSFTIELKDLKVGQKYALSVVDGEGAKASVVSKIQSDVNGVALVSVSVGERSEFELRVV